MKKIYILMASAALMFAASCNKMEETNSTESAVETELITVELNPMTKTSLDGKATVWSEGDAVSVTVNGGENIGSLKLVEGNTFSGEVKAGHQGDAILNYPAGVTAVPTTQKATQNSFADEAALLEGTTTMDELRAGKGATLQNKTALLQFTPTLAGDVVFTLGTTTYTIEGCESNKQYYACVTPVSAVSLSYKIAEQEGAKSKSNVTFEANNLYNLGKIDILKYDVYVCISDLGWESVNMHRFNNSGDLTSWPGDRLSETKVVNNRTYYKQSIPAGDILSFTYNNGKESSNFKIDVKDVTVDKDIYYRLTARGAIEVDPNDETTFGYAIYVFDQKSKNVAPNLYTWNDNGEWKKKYGGTFENWPGVAFKNDCYYQPADGHNWRHYYYYEIPTELYNKTFNYIVNKSGQTSDLTSKNVNSDLYVGYWYNNESSNGFWTDNPMSTPITNLE